jgi:secondary thiamine-phosphate synthase enzyme
VIYSNCFGQHINLLAAIGDKPIDSHENEIGLSLTVGGKLIRMLFGEEGLSGNVSIPRLAALYRWLFFMKSHTEYLTFNLPARMAFDNITQTIASIVAKSEVREGLVLVNAMHITASVFINDDEPGLHTDYAKWLEELAPFDASPARYAHNRTGEDNADAHLKRQIMGREVVVAITNGKLDLGPWEQIFYGEFDGRRAKRVLVKVIGE